MGSGTRLVTTSKKDPNADAIEAVEAALRGDTRTVQGIAAEAAEKAKEAAGRQISEAVIEYSIVPDAAELKRAQVLVDQAIAALPEGTVLERVNYLADLNKEQQLAWGYVMKQLLATTKT